MNREQAKPHHCQHDAADTEQAEGSKHWPPWDPLSSLLEFSGRHRQSAHGTRHFYEYPSRRQARLLWVLNTINGWGPATEVWKIPMPILIARTLPPH